MTSGVAGPAADVTRASIGAAGGPSLVRRLGLGLVLPLLIAVAWEAAVAVGVANGRLMPPPSRVLQTLVRLAQLARLGDRVARSRRLRAR